MVIVKLLMMWWGHKSNSILSDFEHYILFMGFENGENNEDIGWVGTCANQWREHFLLQGMPRPSLGSGLSYGMSAIGNTSEIFQLYCFQIGI